MKGRTTESKFTHRRVHIAGICGRIVGGLAIELKAQGWRVTGSDVVAFPPMSNVLVEHGITFDSGPGPFSVPADTDLIITGSGESSQETGVPAAIASGIPALHFPAFLKEYFLGKSHRLVIVGTNGKTTTTAMLAWILERAGRNPDYLIGGQCPHFPSMVRLRGGKEFVIEGDEYFAQLAERIPKFHFYQPNTLLLTNIAFDHAEVFADAKVIESEFARLISNLPRHGLLIAASSPEVDQLAATAPCRVCRIGWTKDCDVMISHPRRTKNCMSFLIGDQPVRLQLFGRMNALNAALAYTAAVNRGVSPEVAAEALAEFKGVAGRGDTIHETSNLVVISDEGYHPMALRENLAALRLRFPGRRIIAALQARYTGGRGGFQHQELPQALSQADHVILTPVFDYQTFSSGPLTTRTLGAALKRNGSAVHVISKSRHLPAFFRRMYRPGDILFCSLAMRQDAVFAALRETISRLDPALKY